MTSEQLNKEYFGWMCNMVCDTNRSRIKTYRKLLKHLHNIEFTYTNEMDGNRAADGIDLRYQFAHDCGYDFRLVASMIDTQPCSVLEMMVALASRCEVHIMDNPNIGNRTGQWFWNMIESLGLSSMTDAEFSVGYTDIVVGTFLDRKYKRNGKGGLFTVRNNKYNMRTAEIWWQMMWYLNEVLDSESE